MASCAELEVEINLRTQSNDGIDIAWSGYNDSMYAFVTGTVDRIK